MELASTGTTFTDAEDVLFQVERTQKDAEISSLIGLAPWTEGALIIRMARRRYKSNVFHVRFMNKRDSSPDKQLLHKIEDRLMTISVRAKRQKAARMIKEAMGRDGPPQPFLYQG